MHETSLETYMTRHSEPQMKHNELQMKQNYEWNVI